MQETFGQRFQRLRKNAGLTQEDVATKLNITAQAISKWENDVSAPDISVLVELSEILSVSIDELLGKTPTTTLVPQEQRKDIDKMFFRVNIHSKNGDKVKVNLPLALVKAILDSGMVLPQINGKDVLNNIDFRQIFALIEQGVVGKLVEIESADGDIVEVWVE
ncbi:MAG: helix-turn-helix transcriptional regulator [Clostridiales bacterium]|nr:helix-turn-helix transcriptional regulator [Clostridiales bacterium]